MTCSVAILQAKRPTIIMIRLLSYFATRIGRRRHAFSPAPFHAGAHGPPAPRRERAATAPALAAGRRLLRFASGWRVYERARIAYNPRRGGGCTRRGSQNAATGTAARCPRCRLGMLRHQRGACGGANAGRSTQVITRNAAKHLWSRGMASEPVSCPSAPGLDAVPPGTLIVVLCTHRAVAGHAVWTCRACWLQCRAPYAAA